MEFKREIDNLLSLLDYSGESSDDAEGVDQNDGEDDSIRPGLHMLGLTKTYVPTWTSADAFRELYQNWKDAIIGSHNLDPRAFTPVIVATAKEVLITVYDSQNATSEESNRAPLGFIRFDKKTGVLELTNFKAALDLRHLNLGESDKRNDDKMAGTHGEGFKIAALVFCRGGRSVRFTSSSFYWNFGLRGRNRSVLSCRLTEIKSRRMLDQKSRYMRQASRSTFKRNLAANFWEDVSVRIKKGRGEMGRDITEESFKAWIRVILELHPPISAQVSHTEQGDLILDERFKGRLYLKGLRIDGHDKSYIYGYNFIHGEINRDRDRLTKLEDEKNTLSAIWAEAIQQDGTDIKDRYIELMQKHKDCAEVTWTGEKVGKASVEVIWKRMKDTQPGAFYYPEEKHTSGEVPVDHADIIGTHLDLKPVPVSEALWKLLKKFHLPLMPMEEQDRRFDKSQTVLFDQNTFQINIVRVLKASLSLDSRLSSIDLSFVEGGGTQQDLTYVAEDRLVKIHQKWLDFDLTHEDTLCDMPLLAPSENGSQEMFFCDHIVEDLLELILEKVAGKLDIDSHTSKIFRRKARAHLRSMPRHVQITQTDLSDSLEVSWKGNGNTLLSTKHGDLVHFHVTLHKESSCRHRRDILIYQETDLSDSDAAEPEATVLVKCDCPSQVVALTESKALFNGLQSRQKYFPTVARAQDNSFFGAPPTSIKTRSRRSVHNASSSRHSSVTIPDHTSETRPSRGSPKKIVQPSRLTPSPIAHDYAFAHDVEESPSEQEDEPQPHDDEVEWYEWFETEQHREFGKLGANYKRSTAPRLHSSSSVECPHLNFRFERGEFARVVYVDGYAETRYVFVHDIYTDQAQFALNTTYLLVTKYSLRTSTFPLENQESVNNTAVAKEVMLHFDSFDKMGLQEDAESIKLSDIIIAERLDVDCLIDSTEIDFVVESPQDQHNTSLFCRFAIQARRNREACVMPIASHLLPRKDRWKETRFADSSKPVVFDFNPGVLGPAEGFSQAGLEVKQGIGFDPSRHLTWKIRHTTSQTYDGSVKSIFEHFETGGNDTQAESKRANPSIAVVTGGILPFRLKDGNQDLPVLDDFLRVLDDLCDAARSSLKPTFTVMLTSSSMLHAKASKKLYTTLLTLLESRLSVHMRLCSPLDLGLPFQRDIIVLIASTSCSPIPWNAHWPLHDSTRSNTIRALIGDLDFQNTRMVAGTDSAFVCSHSGLRPGAPATKTHQNVLYNHQTGLAPPRSRASLEWDTEKLRVLTLNSKLWVHPSRDDRVTVREVARLQGFPDSFVFYQSRAFQYNDVWQAIPPPITKKLGDMFNYIFRRSQPITITDETRVVRGNKRARREDDMEG